MRPDHNLEPAPGWVGGFAESNPAFAYPDPDLTSLPMPDNMDNIHRIERQQKIIWPEFSWETIQGDPNSRCFQMFSPDISRVGYDSTGRIWSIMCPQQGHCLHDVVCMNVEVTVTGQRGWVDETTREIAADMSVEGTIWFSPSSHQSELVQAGWKLFDKIGAPFPSSKENAIKVKTHKRNQESQPIFPGRTGESTTFDAPDFAKHDTDKTFLTKHVEKAWAVGNIEVEIGDIEKKRFHPLVNWFNEKVLEMFNEASGNMLQSGNLLTWNVWFTAPELVDTEEWRAHAELWRESLEADHGSPTGLGHPARYADGTLFKPLEIDKEDIANFIKEIKSHH
ncbi:MAG: hypothetical protein ACPGWR_30035 [Ardenticatenaceae bacterium]